MRPHASRPWNPLIAQAFYRRGIIEAWGRGTLKMAELTREAGLVAPEFMSTAGEVIVRFRPTRYAPPTRVAHNLSPLQRELLDIVTQVGSVSLKEIGMYLTTATPRRTIQDNLRFLRQLGLIHSNGRGQGARWTMNAALEENGISQARNKS